MEETDGESLDIFRPTSDQDLFSVQNIVNSKKVNQVLLNNVENMIDLEFDIKMKAQLQYLQLVESR